MASSTPTSPPSYGRELSAAILARHQAAQGAGGRLPTERQLAADLGVTRTMVRHALAILEAEGRISREVGRGTFLRPAEQRGGGGTESPATESHEVGPADVMVARRLIEPQVLPLVVSWATTRDFDEMRRSLAGGGAAETYEEFEVWDYALHHAIVTASRNQLLVAMYAVIEQARRGEIWGNLKRRSDSLERRATYHQDHVELVEALCARELSSALRAMERHLSRVADNLLGGGA